MNYRTITHHDDQLLLTSSGKTEEDFCIKTESSRSSEVTKTRKGQSDEESLINNSELGHTALSENQRHVEWGSDISRDTKQNTSRDSYLTRDTSQKQGLSSPSAACNKWVSFDEANKPNSSSTANDDVLTRKLDSSGKPTAVSDQDTPVNKADWVQFKTTARENSGINGIKSILCKEIDTVIVETSNQCGNELQQFEDNLQQFEDNLQRGDTADNPFDNCQPDHVTSHTTSAKNAGGIPSLSTPDSCKFSSSKKAAADNKDEKNVVERSQKKDPTTLLPPYPVKPTSTTWSMLLRYPDVKRRVRGREWRPVVIKLNGSVLQVYDEHDLAAPFREVSLQCFYDLTRPRLQHYHDKNVHTVKMLYVKYKETNKFLSKKNVHYISRTMPILKLASSSHVVIREFIEVVRHGIRSLPIFRDRGISHNTEAVYINVHDTCSAVIDATGSVLMLGILVRIYMRAFISGDAECELVLNDFHMKAREEARLREELMPQHVHKWIKLEECDFHSTVNSNMYNQDHCIMLHPLDACTFEVMQFRVQPLKPLPLLVKCEMIVDTHGHVELRAEVKLCSDPKLAKYERKNICLYFPVPDTWVRLFMKENRLRGEKSIMSTNSQKAIKMRNRKNRPLTTIEVSTGVAKYEPEFKCIVWRINSLPLLNTTAPADSTHDFMCHIQTIDALPDDYKPACALEYDIPYTVASDTNIVNFKVLDKKIATKEVSYHTYYAYEIQMNVTNLSGDLHCNR